MATGTIGSSELAANGSGREPETRRILAGLFRLAPLSSPAPHRRHGAAYGVAQRWPRPNRDRLAPALAWSMPSPDETGQWRDRCRRINKITREALLSTPARDSRRAGPRGCREQHIAQNGVITSTAVAAANRWGQKRAQPNRA